jgi:ribonuclease HI
MDNYILYTDGAYSPSKNQGGLAFIAIKNEQLILEYNKKVNNTTNNQMELGAIIYGLKAIRNPINSLTIISDSMYCIGTITKNWQRKKNIQLWKLFDKEYTRVKNLCQTVLIIFFL